MELAAVHADTLVSNAAPDLAGALSPDDQAALARAVEALERTSFAARLSGLFGKQIELAGRLIPPQAMALASKAAAAAMQQAMQVALRSLPAGPSRRGRVLHRAAAAVSGAAGGALGFAALPIELPVSTTIMLRAIADIARSEGEDLDDPEAALACLQVFALGGGGSADLAEGGYFALRTVLARSVAEAVRFVARKSVVDEAAPVLTRLAAQIAARFGAVVSQKVMAQAVPVIGAVGGAAVNLAFTDHFQSLAAGHFTVRRLERTYGPALVRAEYERLSRLAVAAS